MFTEKQMTDWVGKCCVSNKPCSTCVYTALLEGKISLAMLGFCLLLVLLAGVGKAAPAAPQFLFNHGAMGPDSRNNVNQAAKQQET